MIERAFTQFASGWLVTIDMTIRSATRENERPDECCP